MQDRYAGDIGDFGKFGLARAVGAGRRLGVGWYLTTGEFENNNDGKHVSYLEKPERFRYLDPGAFDALRTFYKLHTAGTLPRTVASLESLALLENTIYFSEHVPYARASRDEWAQRLTTTLRDAEVIFLDPDNGIEGSSLTHKHAAIAELSALRTKGRVVIVYQHQSRVRGGAAAEVPELAAKMRRAGYRRVEIVRLRPYSSRFYVFGDHGAELSQRLEVFAKTWTGLAETYSCS
jgi:hypothetical protein